MAASSATSMTPAVLIGGTVAGVLDLTAALVVSALAGVTPSRVLASITSGLLGDDAYSDGVATAVSGALLHFAMMFVICAVFVAAARRFDALTRHPAVSGPLYGIGVYLFMQYVVLPLSAYPHAVASSAGPILRGMVIHVLCVGLPIAVATRYCLRGTRSISAGGG